MEYTDETTHNVWVTAYGPKVKIEIDGQRLPMSTLTSYTISQHLGEPARLLLEPEDIGSTVFNGLARVAVVDAPDPGPAAAIFLSAIDAEELEGTALARADLGTGPHSLTRAMLTQLGEWASGI
jgi:hypothetical protein